MERERLAVEREMAVAWTTAALGRGRKMPRLNAFLSRFRRRRRVAAVYAPKEMSSERAERLALLAKGVTLSDEPAYESPPEV